MQSISNHKLVHARRDWNTIFFLLQLVNKNIYGLISSIWDMWNIMVLWRRKTRYTEFNIGVKVTGTLIHEWLFTHYIFISGVHQATQVFDDWLLYADAKKHKILSNTCIIGKNLMSLRINQSETCAIFLVKSLEVWK